MWNKNTRKGARPVKEQLGIEHGRSSAVQRALADFGAEESFGQAARRFEEHFTDISFSPDGQRLATGGKYGTVRLWDLQGNELHKFSDHQGSIESISFSLDGQQLTTAGDDNTIRSWNLQGHKLAEEEFPADINKDFTSLSFSPDSRLLAGITDKGTVHVRNLQGEELISSPI